ncbi:MAG: acyl carrier protein, partial [Mycobacteriales bacterium]
TAVDVLAVVQQAVATVLELDPAGVTREQRFVEDLHADSLAIVEVVEMLEEALAAASPGFAIADEDLDDLRTVGDAVEYARERLR